MGPLSWFIGIDVCQHDDYTVSLHQALYVDKLLEKFAPDHDVNGIKHSHPCNPDTFIKLGGPKDDDERERVRKLPYLQLIGSLLYLSTMTRPDIAYHMSVLCKFMQDPSLEAFAAAKSLLLYVGHTKHKGLHFDASTSAPPGLASCKNRVESNHGFVAYSDASWRDPHKFGWNMYGYVVYLYGAPVSFAAKLLKVVALSTAEAECHMGGYVGMAPCGSSANNSGSDLLSRHSAYPVCTAGPRRTLLRAVAPLSLSRIKRHIPLPE